MQFDFNKNRVVLTVFFVNYYQWSAIVEHDIIKVNK